MKKLSLIPHRKYIATRIVVIIFLTCIDMLFAKANDLHITAKPGKVYTLPNSLNDTRIFIDGSGSSDAPFVLAGAANKTTLNGNSAIIIDGDNIIVKDLSFLNNVIYFKNNEALIQIGSKRDPANNILIKNCEFEYSEIFNDLDMASQFYWVEIYGKNNRIDNCTFEGKQNRLPVIHVNSNTWVGDNNTISRCTFKNVKPRNGEALEAIRVGFGKSRSNCKILNNSFINYAGDSETISCKSNGVRIEGNKFLHCRSGISLRAADSCIIKNNKFAETVTPVRISGIGHSIVDNIFDSSATGSIFFMKGGAQSGYKKAQDIDISDNIFFGKVELKMLEPKNGTAIPSNLRFNKNYLYDNETLYKVGDDVNVSDVLKKNPSNTRLKPGNIKEMSYGIENKTPNDDNKILDTIKRYKASKQVN